MMPHYGPPPHQPYPRPPTRYYEQPDAPVQDDFSRLPRSEPVGYMRQGEQVEVRIRGNVWIVGLLVSSLHFISSYLGQGYDVEYSDTRSGKAFRSQFPAEDVRPYTR